LARKILLADDSVTAQNMGRKILADAGYEVITVNNGSAALKKIGEQRPDVIVLDVYMPGYSGLEVCQRLKEVGDTSRIPILLTVGKLEPFKPEEARRVRADAYIVKPFEASELLSALTKLEDKIVPRSESTKPGRFGKAAAALDEPRFDKTMAVEEDEGWKSRISFPRKKKEKEKEEDETPVAVPANQAPEPVAAQPASSPQNADDEKVDLGALSAAGLPKDVTPEEIAALAAAAARVKGRMSEERGPAAEMAVMSSPAVQEPKPEVRKPIAPTPTPKSMAGPGPIYAPEHRVENQEQEKQKEAESKAEPKAEIVAAEAVTAEAKAEQKPEDRPAEAPVSLARNESGEAPAEPADEPVTMAVAPAVAPVEQSPARWTAVAVALAPEDVGVSLEQEMQKAFAASAGAEAGHLTSASMIPVVEESVAARAIASTPEPPEVSAPLGAAPPEPETLRASAAAESVSAAVNEPESMASPCATQSPAFVEPSHVVPPEPSAAATTEAEATLEVPQMAAPEIPTEAPKSESAERLETPAAPEAPIEERPVPAVQTAEAPPAQGLGAEATAKTAPVMEPAAKETSAESSPVVEEVSAKVEEKEIEAREKDTPEPLAEPVADAKHQEPDLGAATAAAWASWKRVHQSNEENDRSPASSAAGDSTQPDTAAMAAAVGGNNPVEEKLADLASDPDVASIVESVLADLRPKIVLEISRKLGKK
jgi:two-component system, chemotaxis family, response regulator PixH